MEISDQTVPLVAVLLPVFNAEETIGETLMSLSNQTFHDFEVVLVNDACTDRTLDIAEQFQSRLNLKIISLQKNLGISGALNAGIQGISSPYIVRLDADDIALHDRLEKQVSFLRDHPEIDVCGSAIEIFSDMEGSTPIKSLRTVDDATIKTMLLQGPVLAHPSVILRKTFFDDVGNYDARFDYAEDYDLWCRGALLGKRFANLPQVLLRYRSHPGQISQEKQQLQVEKDLAVKRKYISALLNGASPGNLAEFFSSRMRFISREVGMMVVRQSMPALFSLQDRVTNKAAFQELVGSCIERHLG